MRASRLFAASFALTVTLGGCGAPDHVGVLPSDGPQVVTPVQPSQEPPKPAVEATQSAPADKAPSEEELLKAAHKRAKLGRDLGIAKENIKKAELALGNQRAENEAGVRKAEVERDLAAQKLKKLQDKDAPQRLAEARLGLRGAQDNLKESEEELQQLEMMYKEEDLADKTREIVLNRGKRRLERSRVALANQERSLENLEKHTIPLEIAELRSALEQKALALDSTRRSSMASLMEKEIALMSARAEVIRIGEEIIEAEKAASQPTTSAK